VRRLLVLGLLLTACTAQQRAETAHAAKVFACEVAVLAPFVPEALEVEELVKGIVTGQVLLPVALGRLGVADAAASAAIDAFNSCFSGPPMQPLPAELEPVPDGEQSKLVAPPPAYGNRVL
jgi:hypothetical protein